MLSLLLPAAAAAAVVAAAFDDADTLLGEGFGIRLALFFFAGCWC